MVTQKHGDTTQVMSLDKAEGINIGATMIDAEVREIIVRKLKGMHVSTRRGPTYLAEMMMEKADFEYYKCNFGEDYRLMEFKMQVPGRTNQWITLR